MKDDWRNFVPVLPSSSVSHLNLEDIRKVAAVVYKLQSKS